MDRAIKTACAGYGAYELKVTYQRNMMLGTLFTMLLVAIVIGGAYAYQQLMPGKDKIEPQIIIIKSIVDLPPPPIIKRPNPLSEASQALAVKPQIGIPKPIKDDEIIGEDVVIFSQNDYADYNTEAIIGDGETSGKKYVFDTLDVVYEEPNQPVFKFTEIPSQMIYEHIPDYPRIARFAGLEAVVWVAVLVDENGNVADAVIYKSSNSKAGFDEAALKSAYKCKFKPAIQNGKPVEVWAVYEVDFELRSVD